MKSKIKKIRIIGFGGIVLALIAVWVLVLSPRTQQPHALDMLKAQAFVTKIGLDKKAKDLNASRIQIPVAEKQILLLTKEFPMVASVPELQAEITATLNRIGISNANILSITVAKPTLNATGDSAEMSIGINVAGSYNQISQFIGSLYNLTRGITIDTVSLASSGIVKGNASYLLTLQARTFLLQPAPAAPRNLPKQ